MKAGLGDLGKRGLGESQLELLCPPPVDETDVRTLEALLLKYRTLSRRDIAGKLGWCERKVRHVAAESDIVLRSPGTRGYSLLEDAEAVEIWQAVNRIRSQMGKMEKTLARYTQVAGLKTALAERTAPVEPDAALAEYLEQV